MSLKGRENVYTCAKCGGYTVTVDLDEGTTPFMIGCRASGRERECDGLASSAFYPPGPRPAHIPPAAWEWYRPTRQQAKRLDRKWPGMLDHVARGGLHLRPRRAARAEGGGDDGARGREPQGPNET